METKQSNYDAQRMLDLEKLGLKVLRFDDRQVLLEMESGLEVIFKTTKKSLLGNLP
jgi:very-short-patch-repair endonuclease